MTRQEVTERSTELAKEAVDRLSVGDVSGASWRLAEALGALTDLEGQHRLPGITVPTGRGYILAIRRWDEQPGQADHAVDPDRR